MRLLQIATDGEISLSREFSPDTIPPYAILSHTWGPREDEVMLEDLQEGTYKTKPGYFKIKLCCEQAMTDGLQYLWVDTCCVDKRSSAELSETITSMFSWYRDSAACYVYLSDVSAGRHKRKRDDEHESWETAFQTSRWFTRSWTLQELLAPASLKFFSREGELLGSRATLVQQIHQITGIPIAALRGSPLSEFSVEERLHWAEGRHATRKEDRAYSLLGMFDIQMPLLYGEGDKAFVRLMQEIEKLDKVLLLDADTDLSQLTSKSPSYSQLPQSGFRLLILESGHLGDTIVGHLATFSLLESPAYYALSYVWGHEPLIHPITVNGESRFIQPSLYHALQRIRPRHGRYYIWVDSLCINQNDNSERNMQVKQMASIYGKASGVLIWLGEEDLTSKLAMDFVSEILSDKFKWVDSWWEQHGFIALARLLERQWFCRGWVLQEVAFSKDSILHCGDRSVYMDHFVMVVYTIRTRLGSVPTAFSSSLANFLDSSAMKFLDTVRCALTFTPSRDEPRRRLSLETLVDLTTSTETTDQRDTIYALLNMANDTVSFSNSTQSETIVPDYQKTVLDVYVDFILHCCSYWGSLDIICRPWAPIPSSSVYAVGNGVQSMPLTQNFPSWIASRDNLPFGNPSWRLKHRLHGDPLVGKSRKPTYYAHYGSKPQVSVIRNRNGKCNGLLNARGLFLGEIADVSVRMANAIVSKECLAMLRETSSEALTDKQELPDAVWRTLCGDRDQKGQRAPHAYSAAMVYILNMSSDFQNSDISSRTVDDVSSIDVEELLSQSSLPEIVEEYLKVLQKTVWNRRTFRSKTRDSISKPLVGLVPPNAKIGDHICILYGCSVPVVLRKTSQPAKRPSWRLIGDAYVHGAMEGEMISSASSETIQSREVNYELV